MSINGYFNWISERMWRECRIEMGGIESDSVTASSGLFFLSIHSMVGTCPASAWNWMIGLLKKTNLKRRNSASPSLLTSVASIARFYKSFSKAGRSCGVGNSCKRCCTIEDRAEYTVGDK